MKTPVPRSIPIFICVGSTALVFAGAWLMAYFAMNNEYDKVYSLGAFLLSALTSFVAYCLSVLVYLLSRMCNQPALADS